MQPSEKTGGLQLVTQPGPDARRFVDAAPAVVETHTALLFFVGDRVYKLKKAVRFPFLDFSTVEARERACRAEVELNRRLAPDVYLGVSTVIGQDRRPCGHLVVMRRMPGERRLSTLIDSRELEVCLRRVARTVAAFHTVAEASPRITEAGTFERVSQLWESNLAELETFVGSILPGGIFSRVRERGRRYLSGRHPLFLSRMAAGKIRDGHGDMLADDIFCLPDGPRILDCLDFDDRLRHGDVVADVAFLAMDLERLGRPDAAAQFLADYREFSAQTYPESLADFYIAHRALVRSKVSCLAVNQRIRDDSIEAVRLLDLAARHLDRGRVRIALVGGLPGTGKSTLASSLASEMRWALLSSDEVRKDITGLGHYDPAPAGFGAGIYDHATTNATYGELIVRAKNLASLGESVVIDASWTDGGWREVASAMARETASDLVALVCETPRKVTVRRILARRRSVTTSDATPSVAALMAARADPWPEAYVIDGTASPSAMLEAALEQVTQYDEPRRIAPV